MRFISLLIATLLVAACATTAGTDVNSLIVDASTLDDSVLQVATSALASGLITSKQAQKVLGITDQVQAALTVARAASAAGDATGAEAQLAAATRLLTTAQACLKATAPGATLDVCLAPVLPTTTTVPTGAT